MVMVSEPISSTNTSIKCSITSSRLLCFNTIRMDQMASFLRWVVLVQDELEPMTLSFSGKVDCKDMAVHRVLERRTDGMKAGIPSAINGRTVLDTGRNRCVHQGCDVFLMNISPTFEPVTLISARDIKSSISHRTCFVSVGGKGFSRSA